jgi:monothiol glutaredoxin
MDEALKNKIIELLGQHEILLFMKGDKYLPQCGFSGQVLEILKQLEVNFTTYDILEDEAIRQGLKEYSNWPTYPQLYYKSELIGGCDIIKEMYQNNSLQKILCPQK